MFRNFYEKLARCLDMGKNSRDRRSRRYLPMLELLEDRTLMSISVGPQWTSLGPAPITQAADAIQPPGPSTPGFVTGAMQAIAVDPTNSNHIYVGTVNGGVWQTQNYTALATNPWTTGTDQLPSLAIMSLAISPVDSNVVYAGTGSISSVYGNITSPGAGGLAVGLYKTTDGGVHWSVVGGSTFSGLRVTRIVATSLNNGQTLFAATTDTNPSSGTITKGGIYYSNDGGTTWNRLSGTDGLPNTGVTELTYNPKYPDQLYAAVPGELHKAGGTGVIFELDVSATSTSVTTAVTNITGTLAGSLLNGSLNTVLAISPADQTPVIWAEVFTTTGQIGAVYRGVENNPDTVTWSSAIGPSGGTPPAIFDNSSSGTLHFALTADPNYDNLVYLGGNSTDYGNGDNIVVRGNSNATGANIWTAISYVQGNSGPGYPQPGTVAPTSDGNVTTAPHTDSRDLVFAGPNLLLTCDGGIYQCANPNGVGETSPATAPTWTSLNGNIAATEVYTVAIDSSNNQVLEAAQDNGTAVLNQGPTTSINNFGTTLVLNQGTATQIQDADGSTVQVDNTNHIQYFETGSFPYWTAIPDTGPNAGKANYPTATVNNATGSYTTLTDGFDSYLYSNAGLYQVNTTGSILVAGKGTLYYSTDEGSTFNSVGGLNSGGTAPQRITVQPYGSGTPYTYTSKVEAIAYGPSNAAYLGLLSGDILYSSNVTQSGGGFVETNFKQLTNALLTPGNIYMNPNNSLNAFAVIYGVGAWETTNGSVWFSITGNLGKLMTPLPSNQATKEQESVTLVPAGSSNPAEILVGGLGGVFQLPLAAATPGGTYNWTAYGANLPNVLVDNLQYYPQNGGTLLAGTLGRGVWEVTNANSTIGQPQTLQITGSPTSSPVTLALDPNNSLNLLVTDGPVSQSIPLGSFQAVNIAANGASTLNIIPLAQVPIITGNPSPASTVMNFNASPSGTPLAVYIKAGQYTAAGMQSVTFSSVGQVYVDNAAAVNAFWGPDTADRPTALSGLTPQQRFVQVLYLDVLHRVGAPSEIAGWVSVLNSQGQAAVAAGIEGSQEARQDLVNIWYETYLGRAADPGASYWSSLLATQTEEQVLSQILGSTEFYNDAQKLESSGTAGQRYVEALYQVLLDRSGAASEVAGWVNNLPTLGNAGVAYDFLTSAEFRTNQIQAYYQTLLHRPADTGGLIYWVNSGQNLLQVREGFEATSEFFQNG